MIKNYFKTAIRNLLRGKGSSLINISGLAMGITCSLVLFLLVRHHATFDSFHTHRDRIYRVVSQSDGNNGKNYSAGVPTPLPEAFRNDFPEAEAVIFAGYRADALVTIPQPSGEPKKYTETAGVVITEPGFFKIFDRPVLIGDAVRGLDDPNEAVISKRWALKFFGKEDAVGEVVKFEDNEYKITAVMEDFPANTDFPLDLMLSYATVKKEREASGWNSIWSDEQCFILLKPGEDAAKLERRLPAFTEKYIGKEDPDHTLFSLQPLKDFHFDQRYDTFSYNTIDKNMLTAFAVIAFILIVTACINFVNLATAEAIKRSKEVGIRKSLGSTKSQLVRQFLGETALVTFISLLIALAFTQLALTFLNPFLDLHLALRFGSDGQLWGFIIVVFVIVALLAGVYPAFVVSGFNPALALKNLISNKNSSGYALRRTLVVAQFVISQFFIIGTIVVINQMNYFQKKDLGFRKDAILIVPIPEKASLQKMETVSKMKTLRDEVAALPGVDQVSLNNAPPSSGYVSSTNMKIEGKDENFATQVKLADGNYAGLFGLTFVSGHNLQDLDTATGFVVNEKLAHTVGFANAANIEGKMLRIRGRTLPVVGVVKDFHTVTLRRPVEATVLMNHIVGYERMAIHVQASAVQDVLAKLKPVWERTYPEHIYSYEFLDQQIAEFYDGERKMSILLAIFSSIAIFIGCLGLFGLVTFMANQKNKEIGVRKVLGASVESIVFMFSKEFVKLIAIGFLVAAPAAWFVMGKFLDEFAYKITMGPEIFLIGLVVTLAIAMFTVGYRSFKAAVVNPVKSLRSE
ncbi:ABC transporter permease [Chryseolinea lacunae]|uniref:ABC transporter permease n=1 Tax=Chryseolinea lacunae TaxID=2801331 RepID=A0ABS1KV50_9BACT|nr:ABC transporter permease [Chryseolinea lacunae]MBL0743341.1 ABC transporter permease [Chryseolinea lacunae]